MKNVKRVLAIAVVILLVGLYIWSAIAAFMAKPGAGQIFNAAIFCTFFFPILLYVYMFTAKWLKGRGVNKEPQEDDNQHIEK